MVEFPRTMRIFLSLFLVSNTGTMNMGKSQAEIQREYRARKKAKEGDAYLQKERARVKKYYVPIPERSTKEQRERRRKVNTWVRRHRQRKQVTQDSSTETNIVSDSHVVNHNETNVEENEISSQTISSTTSERLIVKLKSCDPQVRTRKRVSRATAKCRREIEKLKMQNVHLQRKYKTTAKRFERLQKKVVQFPAPRQINHTYTEADCPEEASNTTPRKRAAKELRQAGLTPKKVPRKVFDKLVLANAMAEEIKGAWKCNGQKGKKIIARVISGQIINKYRFKTQLSSLTGIQRSGFAPSTKRCDNLPKIRKRVDKQNKLKQQIVTFLERDDNSRVMPGKSDKVKTDEGQVQTRFLSDSMSNLHMKFVSENMTKTSLATFCRMRPKYFRLTKFICRNKCLCQKHQNMALILKSAKSAGMNVPLSPDEYVRKLTTLNPQELLSDVTAEEISYQQWAKVELPDGKKRTKIVEKNGSKESFGEKFLKMSVDFTEHVGRVHCQFKAIRDLKENLPAGHVMIQMDFSENYSCVSAEEVQSAYWNSGSVTLHPTVLYFKAADGLLTHKNYMFVSDDNGHNIGAVYTFMKQLVPEIVSSGESVQHVHYWTDSPTYQYRNKTAFYLISAHKELFGISATWDYFEAGHGKGPCDGLGGAAKRMADLAVKQGKSIIQDASEFFRWGQTYQKSVNYIYVSKDECDLSRAELTDINKGLIPVSGTLLVHSVAPISVGMVNTSVTSCYCSQCLVGNRHDITVHNLIRTHGKPRGHTRRIHDENEAEDTNNTEVEDTNNTEVEDTNNTEVEDTNNTEVEDTNSTEDDTNNTEVEDTNNTEVEDTTNTEEDTNEKEEDVSRHQVVKKDTYQAGDWVSVKFGQDWFIGKIIETDYEEEDCKVTFMRQTKCNDATKCTFKWPVPIDELWVKFDDILCKITPPSAMGRSGRSFIISQECLDKIQTTF